MPQESNAPNDDPRRQRDDEGGDEEEQYTTETPQDKSQQAVLLDLEDDDPDQPLGADQRLDRITAEDNAEAVLNEMSDYTEDQEILDDFAERQMMPTGEQGLMRSMRQHHSETPEVTGGDVDAAWGQAEDAGDETPSAEPMPDHDRVGEMGEALGVTYEDDEELDFVEKVWNRDKERWELDPASAETEIDEEDVMSAEDGGDDQRADVGDVDLLDPDLLDSDYDEDVASEGAPEGEFDDEGYAAEEENELDEGPINPLDDSHFEQS